MSIENIPLLDGEEWQAGECISDTDSLIKYIYSLHDICTEYSLNDKCFDELIFELKNYGQEFDFKSNAERLHSITSKFHDSTVRHVSIELESELKIYLFKYYKVF